MSMTLKNLEEKVRDLLRKVDHGMQKEVNEALYEAIYEMKSVLDLTCAKIFQNEFSEDNIVLKEELSRNLITLNKIQSQIEGVAEMIYISDELSNQIALNIVSLDDLDAFVSS